MTTVSPTSVGERSSTASRAAAHAVQAKLSVSQKDDSYEQEADRVAGVVVNHSSSTDSQRTSTQARTSSSVAGVVAAHVAPKISRLIYRSPQRKVQLQEEEEAQTKVQRQEEEEETQTKVQRQEEEEAQTKVQRQEEEEEAQTKVQRQEEEEEAQTKVQRQEEEEEAQTKVQRQEEEEAQTKVQRQEEEEEAQTKVQRQEEEEEAQPKVQRQEEEEEAQPKVQRQEEEEEAQAKVQLKEKRDSQKENIEKEEEKSVQAKTEARPNVRDKQQSPSLGKVEGKLFSNKGKGESLDDETRVSMESGFGADFSGVKVHTDSDAVAMSRDLNAQAFTHGKDVFFNSGKFEPDTVRGKMLLAHELTHVVQQGAAEQKLSEGSIAENNAKKDQLPPEPTDKEAQTVEETTKAKIEQSEPQPVDNPPMKVSPESTGEASAQEAKTATSDEAKPTEEGKPGKTEEKKDAQATKGKEEKAGKNGGGKGKAELKAKGGGVGAFLKKMTEVVFKSKKTQVSQLASNEKTKDAPEKKLEQTQKSVVPPAEEGQSRAKASQVETVEQVKAPEPDEAQAKQQFNTALDNAVPSSLEEADKFKEEGKGRVVGEAVKGVVTADTQQVKGTYQEIDNPPAPQPPEQSPEELPALEEAPETGAIAMGEGVVGEVQAEHTDLTEFDQDSDKLLQEEGITDEQLEMVDEGDLAEAKQDRKTVKSQVKEGPKEVKQLEQKEKQKVNQELQKEEEAGRQEMRAERQRELHGARDDQQKTKSAIELKRQKVTEHINGIYQKANDTVKKKLDDLEAKSMRAFDESERQATQTFEGNVKRRIDGFKRRRYDRFGGSLLWLKDKLLGMDDLPEVKNIFESEKSRFIASIDSAIKKITEENTRVIQECKDIVAQAKKDIEVFVQGLGPELQKTGQQAMTDMKGKLDALDKKINDKAKELQEKLAAKREAAIKAIEEKIEKMKEEMSGLLSKLGNLLLNAMLKFFKWALKKAGFSPDELMAIINKGKSVIKKIVTDPIGFIGNIIKAVKGGINLFKTNIKKHLIGGLISWLTGAMADVPITLPAKFDLKGILHLVLQILGLTWDRIRQKLVKRVGEKVVKIAETTVDIVRKLITEGPMALWEMIKAKAAEIKQKVMDGIRNWVITQVVKQGIIKLVSFLNPAGAIIQAIIAIYNTVMFFVENIQRIIEFVKTVFNSIGNIAMGKISAAAQAVERTMAMTIPIILNFIARLLGLSGIGKAISGVIKKIRAPIDKIVNKVLDGIVKMAKKLVGKGKAGAKALKEKGLAMLKWWTGKKKFKSPEGESHSLFFQGGSASAKLMVASKKSYIKTFIKREAKTDAAKIEGLGFVKKVEDAVRTVKTVDKQLKKQRHNRGLIAKQKKAVDQLTLDISSLTVFLMDPTKMGTSVSLPPTKIKYRKSDVNAEFLSSETTGGSAPSATNVPGYKMLQAADFTAPGKRKDNWVRMHVLNKHLGGKGEEKHNLVMGPSSVNLGPDMKGFEGKLKQLLKPRNGPKAGRYAVAWMVGKKEPQVNQQLEAQNKKVIQTGVLTKEIKYSGGFYKQKSEFAWSKQQATITARVEIPLPDVPKEPFKPNLRTATPLLLKNAYAREFPSDAGRALAAFKHPAVPELRDSYPSKGAVLTRIPQLDIPANQKPNLLSVMRKLLSKNAVDL